MSDYNKAQQKGRLISEMVQNRIKSLRSYRPYKKQPLSAYFRSNLEGAISERQEKLEVPEGFTHKEKQAFTNGIDIQIISELYKSTVMNRDCNPNVTLEILDIIYEMANRHKYPTPDLDIALLEAVGISAKVEISPVVKIGLVHGTDYN